MARVLDLNTVERPTLELTLQDEARTIVRVTTPTEGLIQELQAVAPELEKSLTKGDEESQKDIYDLAAKLISCNRDSIKITGEELRGKYRMNLESAIVFYDAYMDFINEIFKLKN